MQNKLILSSLNHTWILDIDGTICVHNGYKNGKEELLPGVKEFFNTIPKNDMIILITSRKSTERDNIDNFMNLNKLRYDHIIFNAPMGERILINDDKPSGLKMAYSINKERDSKLIIDFKIDEIL